MRATTVHCALTVPIDFSSQLLSALFNRLQSNKQLPHKELFFYLRCACNMETALRNLPHPTDILVTGGAIRKVFLPVLRFSPVIIFPPLLHIHIYFLYQRRHIFHSVQIFSVRIFVYPQYCFKFQTLVRKVNLWQLLNCNSRN